MSDEVQESIYSHDPLTQSLLAYGAVPVGLFILILGWLLIRTHRGMFLIKERRERWLAALALGTAGSVVATSMLSGSRTSIFPITVFLWLMLGFIWARISANQKNVVADKAVDSSPMPLRHPQHRFVPTAGVGRMPPGVPDQFTRRGFE